MSTSISALTRLWECFKMNSMPISLPTYRNGCLAFSLSRMCSSHGRHEAAPFMLNSPPSHYHCISFCAAV